MVRWKMGPWMMSLVTSARGTFFPFFPTSMIMGHGRKSRKDTHAREWKNVPFSKRNFHLPTVNFQGDVLVFKGVEAEWNGIEAWIRSLSPIFCILAMLGLGGAMKGSGYGLQKFRDPQNELELVYFGCLGYFEKKDSIGYFCWVVWIWSVFFAFLCQAVWWHQQVLWRNPEVWKEYLSNCLDDRRAFRSLRYVNTSFRWHASLCFTMCPLPLPVEAFATPWLPHVSVFFVCILLEGKILFQVQLSPHHHLPCVFSCEGFLLTFPTNFSDFVTWNWTPWGLSALQEAGKSSSWGWWVVGAGNPRKIWDFSSKLPGKK